MGYRRLQLDGRAVEYVLDGPEDAAGLLVFHVGSPNAAVSWPALTHAAAARGLRVASYSRGGYGGSARREGRSVADEAAITTALADRLGFNQFLTVGWSGGGPVALACAALAPGRVRAAMALASMAPPVEAGPAGRSMWRPEQRKEWEELESGDPSELLPEFEAAAEQFRRMTPTRLRGLGGEPDARAVAFDHTTAILPQLIRSMRRAVVHGPFGFLDDNLAQARDWGFRVADIRVPVVVRHGELDRLVPVAHGRWLAEAIQGSRAVILPDAGHGSIALPWDDVVRDVLEAAATAGR